MADNFEKDFMKVMREKAAAKALLDSETFKPDQSITNEQAKAMNLPEANVKTDYFVTYKNPDGTPSPTFTRNKEVDEMRVAASPVGGETPEEAYQTSLKMSEEATDRQTEAEEDRYELYQEGAKIFKEVGLATGGDRQSDGQYYMKRPGNFTELARDLLSLEEQGVAQFSPKFKKQLEFIVGSLKNRREALADKSTHEYRSARDLTQSAEDIDELLLTDKSKK